MIVQVASSFTSAPIASSLRRTLVQECASEELGFTEYGRISEYMLTPSAEWADVAGTLVLLRVEDWVRDLLKAAPPAAASGSARDILRETLRMRVDEMAGQLASLAQRGKHAWVLPCPSTGWISNRHKVQTLCSTYTNLLIARAEAIPGLTTIPWPSALFDDACDDRGADRLGQIPFTQETFDRLGVFLGALISRTLTRQVAGLCPNTAGNSEALAAYLESLRVHVQLTTAGQSQREQVDRFLRTAAAFTLTGEKRDISDTEIDALLSSESCFLVSVSDRLSDHGPSGLVTFRQEGESLLVRSMSLSCAVLGKQVEHAVLAALIEIAARRGCRKLEFAYAASERNQPMLRFLLSVTGNTSEDRYVLPLDVAEARLKAAAVNAGAWAVELERGLETSIAQ